MSLWFRGDINETASLNWVRADVCMCECEELMIRVLYYMEWLLCNIGMPTTSVYMEHMWYTSMEERLMRYCTLCDQIPDLGVLL